MALRDLVDKDPIDIAEVASHLDSLDNAARVNEVRGLPARSLRRLFAAAKGFRPLKPDFFVPAGRPAMEIVRHYGVNDLPMFRAFEKQMYRTEAGSIHGMNVQFWAWLTGPGYFTIAEDDAAEDPVFFNYVELPGAAPQGWPKISSNARGFSFFVYRGLADYMRAITDDVTIGKAYRSGKDIGQHFVLVREA